MKLSRFSRDLCGKPSKFLNNLAVHRALATLTPTTLGWWKGLRAPGTHIPSVIVAGTFYQDGKRIFWDVKNPENTIVIELADERYNQLIIEVTNPIKTVEAIQSAKKVQQFGS